MPVAREQQCQEGIRKGTCAGVAGIKCADLGAALKQVTFRSLQGCKAWLVLEGCSCANPES